MEKVQSTISYYSQPAFQLTGDAKNYLNRQIKVLEGYGTSISEYGAQAMDQIRRFPARAKAFYNVIDQTAHTASRGLILGGMIGLFTTGVLGAYAGAQIGFQLGASIGLFNGINEFSNQVHSERF